MRPSQAISYGKPLAATVSRTASDSLTTASDSLTLPLAQGSPAQAADSSTLPLASSSPTALPQMQANVSGYTSDAMANTLPMQPATPRASSPTPAKNGAITSGSKMHFGSNPSSNPASNREVAQLPAVSSDVTAANPAVVIPAGQAPASPESAPSSQRNGRSSGDESYGKFSSVVDYRAAAAAHEMPQQSPTPQAAANPVATAPSVDRATPALPPDGAVDARAQAAASTIAGATDQGAIAPAAAAIAVQTAGEIFALPMELPMAGAAPNNVSGTQLAGKAAQKQSTGAIGAKNPDPGNAADTGKSKAEDATGASVDTLTHDAQANGQPAQHSQTDMAQAPAVASKAIDNGASQMQAPLSHVVSHQMATATLAPTTVAASSAQSHQPGVAAPSQADSDEAAATSGIDTAKIIQTMGESEMRVGMHSSDFGNISIRTSVSQQQMTAQISVDHSDLSQAISAHVSTVQAKLGDDYGLHAQILVNQQDTSSSGQPGQPQQREQRAYTPSARVDTTDATAEADVGIGLSAMAGAGNGYRLDIRA